MERILLEVLETSGIPFGRNPEEDPEFEVGAVEDLCAAGTLCAPCVVGALGAVDAL